MEIMLPEKVIRHVKPRGQHPDHGNGGGNGFLHHIPQLAGKDLPPFSGHGLSLDGKHVAAGGGIGQTVYRAHNVPVFIFHGRLSRAQI